MCWGWWRSTRPPPPHTHIHYIPSFLCPPHLLSCLLKRILTGRKTISQNEYNPKVSTNTILPFPSPPPSSLLWFVSCPSLFLNTQCTLWKRYSKYHPFLELWYEIYQYHPWHCFLFFMIFTIHGFFWEKKNPSGSKNIRTAFHCRLPCFIWHRTNGPC